MSGDDKWDPPRMQKRFPGLSAVGPAGIAPHRKTLGLTGNPGAGKSAAARIMAELGARIFNADEAGHALLRRSSPVFSKIVDAFGSEILGDGGDVDRGKLGKIVFGSEDQLQRLNELVHPEIRNAIRNRIETFRSTDEKGPLVVEAALLYEWGAEELFDSVIVIAAPVDVRRRRFVDARGDPGNFFDRREAAQLPESTKIQRADVVFQNAEGLDQLDKQITEFMNH